MAYTLLGGSVSPFVRKVRVVLAEKGLDYAHEPISPFSPPEGWREISPLGKIPVFRVHGEDDDLTIPDSSVICAYLERRHPTPSLYPEKDSDYARALWLEEYSDGGVVPSAGPNLFFPLVLKPMMTGEEADETEPRRFFEEQMPATFDYLEEQVGDGEFLVGNQLSIADISVASPFVNLRFAGFAPERARWPRLRSYLERIHARPSFKALIDEDTPIFGKRATLVTD